MKDWTYGYEDLIAWQKAISLTESVYLFTKGYPKDELYGLVSQTRRAAVSLPLNIAEGQARGSKKEFRQFLLIARGSAYELLTSLLIASKLGYLTQEQYSSLEEKTSEVTKLISGLINSLK